MSFEVDTDTSLKIWKYENVKIIFMRFVRMTWTCLEEEGHILEIYFEKEKKCSHCKFRKESKNNGFMAKCNKRLLCFNSGSIYNKVKVENHQSTFWEIPWLQIITNIFEIELLKIAQKTIILTVLIFVNSFSWNLNVCLNHSHRTKTMY